MAQIRVTISPKQAKFIHSKAKYPAFIAGLGSGKTVGGCLRALEWVHKGDGMILAPTYPMLRDVTIRTFLQLADKQGLAYEYLKGEERCIMCGHQVLFRSADSPERLRGVNLMWAYLDEAAQMSETVWNIILGRLRVGEPSAWITGTPCGFNWVWRRWVDKRESNYEFTHATTGDNPFLAPGYLNDLVANYTGEFAKQEIEGDFVAFEGLVYPEFSRDKNVTKHDPLPDWRRMRAIDYGYTNPFVCLFAAVDEDGRLVIYDEHYRTKTLIKDHAEAIRRRAGRFSFTVADTDAQDNAEMGAVGIATRSAQKDVIRGIQKVKARLVAQLDGRPRLLIHERCTNTLRELGSYRWSETKEGRNEKEEPVKENDHAMDALRYLVMELDNQRTYVYA